MEINQNLINNKCNSLRLKELDDNAGAEITHGTWQIDEKSHGWMIMRNYSAGKSWNGISI